MGNQFEIKAIDERHFSEYLKDESRLTGKCGKIVFPKDEAEAERIAAWAWKEGKTVTVQGARTGIAGAAVPKDCDLILNMEKMDRILGLEEKDGVFFLSVEPGVTLEAIKRALETKKLPMGRLGEEAKTAFFNTSLEFPPNPTEKTASIGGVFSCGAAGMNERAVGATSGYFEEITILSPQRGKWEIRRGELVVQSLSEPSPWKKPLVIDGERDMLDFLCGSEGMFGAITKLKLRLAKRPRETWGILCFFQEESQAAAFALELAETAPKGAQCRGLEFFDRVSLELVELLKKSASKLGAIPAVPECAQAAVMWNLLRKIRVGWRRLSRRF